MRSAPKILLYCLLFAQATVMTGKKDHIFNISNAVYAILKDSSFEANCTLGFFQWILGFTGFEAIFHILKLAANFLFKQGVKMTLKPENLKTLKPENP